MHQLITVFVSTATGVRLFAGGYDPMANDAVHMLVREFELQYLTARLSFFTGLMSLIAAMVMLSHVLEKFAYLPTSPRGTLN